MKLSGSQDLDIKALFDLAEQYWPKPIGLVFSVIMAVFVSITLFSGIVENATIVLVSIIAVFAVIAIWFYSNCIKKTKKGKVGFVVSILCSNEKEDQLIREDFIATLRKLLKDSTVGNTFDFIEIPTHISKTIKDNDDAIALRAKLKAHFVVYGRIRLRTLDEKEYHILDLNGIVAHKPLPQEVCVQLSTEFSELFPKHLKIPIENDLLSFQFTSDWIDCIAKYIIGLAAFCSLDLDYAEYLYLDVKKKLESIKTDFPIFEKLKQRLPIRFSEIFITRSNIYFKTWLKSKSIENLEKFCYNLNKISDTFSKDYDVLLLRGIEAFLNGRNIQKALEYTKQCKHFDDPIWHFNLAFLFAYENNLKKSIYEYRIGAKYELLPETISQIEDFIVWILEDEPNKYQYYYCLGFFNWKIKGDLKRALYDFKIFLNSAKQGEFEKEKDLANKWVTEIKQSVLLTFTAGILCKIFTIPLG